MRNALHWLLAWVATMSSRDNEIRSSLYINKSLRGTHARAKASGNTLSGELKRIVERFDVAMRDRMPHVSTEEVAALRLMLMTEGEVVRIDRLRPRVLAAHLEDRMDPAVMTEDVQHTAAALCRRIAHMEQAEAVALVEAVERWLYRPDSQQDDKPLKEFIAFDIR